MKRLFCVIGVLLSWYILSATTTEFESKITLGRTNISGNTTSEGTAISLSAVIDISERVSIRPQLLSVDFYNGYTSFGVSLVGGGDVLYTLPYNRTISPYIIGGFLLYNIDGKSILGLEAGIGGEVPLQENLDIIGEIGFGIAAITDFPSTTSLFIALGLRG